MSNVDYSFMTTGFQTLQGVEQLSQTEKAQLMSTIVVYFQEAIKIAEGVVLYELRKEITGEDIILALKVQALDHSGIWDQEETQQRVRDEFPGIYEELTTPNTLEAVEESEEEIEEESEIREEEEIEDRDTRQLDSETYQLIKSADERWKEWQPTDDLNKILKSAIDKTEEKIKQEESVE